MEIPLGTHPGTIRIEKLYTKTVSILSFLMFEKCRFCENYPPRSYSTLPVNIVQALFFAVLQLFGHSRIRNLHVRTYNTASATQKKSNSPSSIVQNVKFGDNRFGRSNATSRSVALGI